MARLTRLHDFYKDQAAFLFVGFTGLVWLVFWWKWYYTPGVPAGAPPEKPIPVLTLLRTRFVVAFTISKIFLDPVWYFYIFWFPKYLKAARGFDLARIGAIAWIPFMVAGFGNIDLHDVTNGVTVTTATTTIGHITIVADGGA